MNQARKTLQEARKMLDKALPIYEGHRVRSRELAHIADEEIVEGIKWEHKHTTGPEQEKLTAKVNQKVGAIHSEENALKKYTVQEIQASNAFVQQALVLEQQALTLLQQAPSDYGGERAEALQLVTQAISEAQMALKLRS